MHKDLLVFDEKVTLPSKISTTQCFSQFFVFKLLKQHILDDTNLDAFDVLFLHPDWEDDAD